MLHLRLIALALVACSACAAATVGPSEGDGDEVPSDTGEPVPGDCSALPGAGDQSREQMVRDGLPARATELAWTRPADWTVLGPFDGTPGQPATHDGDDYIHDVPAVSNVDVVAAAAGTVVYARTDCPQSEMFGRNELDPECGWGWGNHVVIHHGGALFTRYAHLQPKTVVVVAGDEVPLGQRLASMGNSGDSDVRHLHFELGSRSGTFAACGVDQTFDAVFDPGLLPFDAEPPEDPTSNYGRIECPVGYSLESVNDAGGQLCTDGVNALGPFTAAMVERCVAAGGGNACSTDRWAVDLAFRIFGDGECPMGAERDLATGYCIEGTEAFGPFPSDMVAECIARGGGQLGCTSARWDAELMRRIYEALRG